jgi:UrcA family protein
MFGHNANLKHILLLAGLAGFCSMLALPALAQTKSVVLHHDDLDLTTDAGRNELQARISRAVDRVCGRSTGVPLDQVAAYTACTKTAMATAMQRYEVVIRQDQERRVAAAGQKRQALR